MDKQSFLVFVDHYDFDDSMTRWWAPEQRTEAFFTQCTESERLYVFNFIRVLDEVYNNRGEAILRAAMVLTENCTSFQNRINGTIKDDWLTEKTFGSIAAECVIILNHLPHLEDWQVTLKEIFEQMKPAPAPPMPIINQSSKTILDTFDYTIVDQIVKFIFASRNAFFEGKINMTMFPNDNVSLNDIIEVYKIVKEENPILFNGIRHGINSDGKFILFYSQPNKTNDNKESENSDIVNITI